MSAKTVHPLEREERDDDERDSHRQRNVASCQSGGGRTGCPSGAFHDRGERVEDVERLNRSGTADIGYATGVM
jgi:hypothetical protein